MVAPSNDRMTSVALAVGTAARAPATTMVAPPIR